MVRSQFPYRLVLGAVLSVLAAGAVSAQERIDGTFPFESDPAKKYSLYIPSTYVEGTPNRLMVGFHPLNTARWNAESWCDTLIVFSETNGLLLACPDGGADGRVDDPIDFRFTEALMDSVATWYSVDSGKTYAMGFSWGGRATYTFGLDHTGDFGGYLPIGAAINGTTEVGSLIENADGEPFYIVHGANDTPGVRFFPIRDALIDNGAIVEWNLLPGVGHTIDFPDRNEILTTAFAWIDSVNCAQPIDVAEVSPPVKRGWTLAPNPIRQGQVARLVPLVPGNETVSIDVYDVAGRRLVSWNRRTGATALPTDSLAPGVYVVRIRERTGSEQQLKLEVY